MTHLVELKKVSKQYAQPDSREPLWILKDADLSVSPGDSVAIVGPSGSGKSTLLNMIGALDHPSSGQVLLDGEDLANMGEPALAAVRNRRIGYVFQLHHLLPQCTAIENVLVPTLVGAERAACRENVERARLLLEKVGLSARCHYRPAQLSGGELQRVAVARALINRPQLLLADEPTGSLDHAAAAGVVDLLTRLNAEEVVALIVVTHAAALALRLRRVLELTDGRLVPREGPS